MEKTQNIARFYIFLSVVSVIIMSIAAYITYGYQKREVFVSLSTPEKKKEKPVNDIVISPDLSKLPSDDVLKDILNNTLPKVCDDCDDDILDCIEDYEINKIFVQNEGYQDQLIVELITGKNNAVYTTVIDLNDYTVLSSSGTLDDKECFEEIKKETKKQKTFIDSGDDPDNSHYVDVPDTEVVDKNKL
ncbi:MAG: hypothetical protein CR972_03115 [Candidatus Moraniibacteriota bacterium]|nr:MAG: hypothetical protein CR972_03115 [Candidatus Moranbacteria bacterium]